MGQITLTIGPIPGLLIIEPEVHGDERGHFMETFNRRDLEKAALRAEFVQDNQSMSRRGVLRGMHFQKHSPQGKLVRVISGSIFDVAVDMRTDFSFTVGGLAWNCPARIANSCIFLRDLLMAFWFSAIPLRYAIRPRITTALRTKADSLGMIRR